MRAKSNPILLCVCILVACGGASPESGFDTGSGSGPGGDGGASGSGGGLGGGGSGQGSGGGAAGTVYLYAPVVAPGVK